MSQDLRPVLTSHPATGSGVVIASEANRTGYTITYTTRWGESRTLRNLGADVLNRAAALEKRGYTVVVNRPRYF